jgi:hypothetical protein
MNATECPSGHSSTDAEWCDVCGAKIGGAAPTVSTPAQPAASVPSEPVIAEPCPHCGAANDTDSLFCEGCGYDFTTGQTPPTAAAAEPSAADPSDDSATWVVVIEVDAEWFALKGELADAALPDPSSSTVPLVGHTVLIGRASRSQGVKPAISLDADTGVSRRHAQLVLDRQSLSLIDLVSTNGTYLVRTGDEPDEATEPVAPSVPHALADGDRLYLGAWSKLTVRRSR